MPRPGTNYLNLTLGSLLCQLPARSSSRRVCVAVYSVRSATSGAFRSAAAALAGHPDVFFLAAEEQGADASLGRTRRQTVDVARMLLRLEPLAKLFAFMEDDWLLCEGGMRALLYAIHKASLYEASPPWAALRYSYGLNGILVRSADLRALAAFLLRPADEAENTEPDAPVDHLTYRWLRAKYPSGRRYFGGRRIVAFRHTLYWHIGERSSLNNAPERHRPRCYALTSEWLFPQESFQLERCADDDISPCDRRPTAEQGLRAIDRLAAEAEAASAAATRCGTWRVCWGKPAGDSAERRCAAQMLCPRARDPGGGDGGPQQCMGRTQQPEYKQRDG